jgi:plastocyanin
MLRSRTWRAVAALTALAALASACGDDDDTDTGADEASSTTAAGGGDGGGADDGSVAVTSVDYRFEGLPSEVAAGTTFTLTNTSAAEVHEIVAIRIPDAETRSVDELLQLSEEELGTAFGGEPSPALVIVALPGGEGQVALPPTGEPAVTEPGRYLFACFVPLGADPAVYQEALESGSQEPPAVEGPPHATQGMYAEVRVA